MNIYLIRHGQTEWNKLSKWQGHNAVPLDEIGLAQAKACAARFKNGVIGKIWTSDLKRARQTAAEVAEASGVSVFEDAGLREINLGELNGKTTDEVMSLCGAEGWAKNGAKHFGGESPGDVTERIVKTITKIAENEEGDFAVVSHRMTIRSFVCAVLGVSDANRDNFTLDNTSVTIVEYDKSGEKFRVLRLNDNTHISRF